MAAAGRLIVPVDAPFRRRNSLSDRLGLYPYGQAAKEENSFVIPVAVQVRERKYRPSASARSAVPQQERTL